MLVSDQEKFSDIDVLLSEFHFRRHDLSTGELFANAFFKHHYDSNYQEIILEQLCRSTQFDSSLQEHIEGIISHSEFFEFSVDFMGTLHETERMIKSNVESLQREERQKIRNLCCQNIQEICNYFESKSKIKKTGFDVESTLGVLYYYIFDFKKSEEFFLESIKKYQTIDSFVYLSELMFFNSKHELAAIFLEQALLRMNLFKQGSKYGLQLQNPEFPTIHKISGPIFFGPEKIIAKKSTNLDDLINEFRITNTASNLRFSSPESMYPQPITILENFGYYYLFERRLQGKDIFGIINNANIPEENKTWALELIIDNLELIHFRLPKHPDLKPTINFWNQARKRIHTLQIQNELKKQMIDSYTPVLKALNVENNQKVYYKDSNPHNWLLEPQRKQDHLILLLRLILYPFGL